MAESIDSANRKRLQRRMEAQSIRLHSQVPISHRSTGNNSDSKDSE